MLLELAREVTAEASVSLVHACGACGSSRHGRPLVRAGSRRIAASVSRPHEEGPAVVALSMGSQVGVDIEGPDAGAFTGFDEIALHPHESCRSTAERTRLWVRKEALLKAHGTGLTTDPRTIHLAADGTVLEGPRGTVMDLDLGPRWVGALAVTPPAPIRAVLSE